MVIVERKPDFATLPARNAQVRISDTISNKSRVLGQINCV